VDEVEAALASGVRIFPVDLAARMREFGGGSMRRDDE
jgi:hypothetical protein